MGGVDLKALLPAARVVGLAWDPVAESDEQSDADSQQSTKRNAACSPVRQLDASCVDEVLVGLDALHAGQRSPSAGFDDHRGSRLLLRIVDRRQSSALELAFCLPLSEGLGRAAQHFKGLQGVCWREQKLTEMQLWHESTLSAFKTSRPCELEIFFMFWPKSRFPLAVSSAWDFGVNQQERERLELLFHFFGRRAIHVWSGFYKMLSNFKFHVNMLTCKKKGIHMKVTRIIIKNRTLSAKQQEWQSVETRDHLFEDAASCNSNIDR